MIEYRCTDCDKSEILAGIVPMKACPQCGFLMEAVEYEG
ncbi:hypothetical protein SD78_4108 [Bacillus badius]|nr:hypothetical protein SD78_4108 [Bacillus badius]